MIADHEEVPMNGELRKMLGSLHDGALPLDTPEGAARFRAALVGECGRYIRSYHEKILEFKARLPVYGMLSNDAVVVIVNADDVHGAQLARDIHPERDWEDRQRRGMSPLVCVLAHRPQVLEIVARLDPEIAEQLRQMNGLAAVVIDYGIAAVFPI